MTHEEKNNNLIDLHSHAQNLDSQQFSENLFRGKLHIVVSCDSES